MTDIELDALVQRLNSLDKDAWMAQPVSLRVALDVLNPETSGKGRTPLERELARYIVALHHAGDETAERAHA